MHIRCFMLTALLTSALFLAACSDDAPPDQPKPDAAKTPPDGAKPTPDGVKPTPDGVKPTPDGVKPTPDGVKPTPDMDSKDGKVTDSAKGDMTPLDHAVPDALACPVSTTCMTYSKGSGKCVGTPAPYGKTCDDQNLCTSVDQCDGKGTCAGTPYSCDDKVSCTVDTCDGKGGCTSTLAPTSCYIGKVCQTSGAKNPANKCQQCLPSKSTTAWSAVPNCTLCGDGKVTYPEQCDGAQLDGKTCKTQGQDGGTLKCALCKFDLSSCFKCAAGTGDCNTTPGDLCETNLLTDLSHCGQCNLACPAPPANGVAQCLNGACTWSCKSGYFKMYGKCMKDQIKEACDKQDNDFDTEIDEGCGIGTCGDPRVVNPMGGAYNHNSNGYGSHTGSCGVTTGLEFIYRWKPLTSGTAKVHLKTNYWPCAIYVRKGNCSSGTELACKAHSGNWPDYSLSFPVTAGTTYYVFADNKYGGSVALSHTITFTAP